LSLTPGTRLGVYEVVSQIGAGGMGEVYRATDSRLKRSVAIKVLPASVAGDADRLARFQREAEVLAALNHPNIAAIHGFEDSTGVHALVLELVEGPTLADRIARGPIPIDEALPIAKQIADALEAAHEQGIIHRDLKPANIKVRTDGTVKVLDFGLAKAMEPIALSGGTATMSPTLSVHATQAGIVLGTAAYMAPEQAKGKTIDTRVDIWAFGAVLYEMLTGRRTFSGDDVTDTLAHVLMQDPDWTALPEGTPSPIRRLLKRCLEKDRKRRIAAAADVRLDIEDALTSFSDETTRTQSRDPTRGWSHLVVAIVAVVLGVGGTLTWRAAIRESGTRETSRLLMRVEIHTPANPLAFVLSPDGRYLAFVASNDGPQRLWLRPLDKTDARPLAGTEGANYPFWSPDSRSIGFFASGKLRRIDVDGSQPQDIAQAFASGATWNADGTILFVPSAGSPLSRVSASGGTPVAVARLDPPRIVAHRWPHFLPDGRHFLVYVGGGANVTGLYLGSLDGDELKRLTTNPWAGEYLAPGLVVTVRQGALVAQKLDLKRGELTGDLITVAYPVDYASGYFEGFSVTDSGLIAYRASGHRQQLTWFDRAGRPLGAAGESDTNFINYAELSPDDRMIAVQRVVEGNGDIWLMNVLGGSWNRLTFDPGGDTYPLWSPDGSRLVFASSRKVVRDLYWKASNGGTADEVLLETPNNKVAEDWSKDGKHLLYAEYDPKTGSDLWVLDMAASERKARAFVNTAFEETMGKFSPDGRWVAYETNESGRSQIVVTSFPNAIGRWQVSVGGGTQPRWRSDGRELYFIASDGKLMAVPVSGSGTAFEARPGVPLFQVQIVTADAVASKPQYAVTRDGRFLINQSAREATVTPITLLMNWNAGATR
jgi:serine/threonine protein kinase